MNKYTDLMYFGYEYNKDSKRFQQEFIAEIKERFPEVELRNAYDGIKGYRQEVYVDETNQDNFFAWLIGKGWFEMSLTMQIMMMSSGKEPEQKAKFLKYMELAKGQYPEAFKPEALTNNADSTKQE